MYTILGIRLRCLFGIQLGGGDDKLKISSGKVSIWGSILQTILSNFPIYFLFRSLKKPTMAKLLFHVFAPPGRSAS